MAGWKTLRSLDLFRCQHERGILGGPAARRILARLCDVRAPFAAMRLDAETNLTHHLPFRTKSCVNRGNDRRPAKNRRVQLPES